MSNECMSLPPLRECPFCGGGAELVLVDWCAMYYVRCENDRNKCEVIPETRHFVVEREAISAWNRRAGDSNDP